MAESTAVPPLAASDLPAVRSLPLPRWLAFALLALMLMFIGVEGRSLWKEWASLQADLKGARRMEVIGYPGIQPRFNYARRPANWFRVEGTQAFLWGGWVDGQGHSWFHVGADDLERERVMYIRPRDVQLAIDEPITESEGGAIWSRVPDEAQVHVGTLDGVETAYPLLVLDKVGVVNDQIRDRPFLVIYCPFGPDEERTNVYEPVVDGQRITMGTTGYFHDRKPMLYDRGSESLWVDAGGELTAVAGKYKGRSLKRLARAKPAIWQAWRSDHPEGRLVVGANRAAAVPAL